MILEALQEHFQERIDKETPESVADMVIQDRERRHKREDLKQRADDVLRSRGMLPEFTSPRELSDDFEADLIKHIAGGVASVPSVIFNEAEAKGVVEFAILIRQAYQNELNARASTEKTNTPTPATSGSKQLGGDSQTEN